jgi:hypothetical protein
MRVAQAGRERNCRLPQGWNARGGGASVLPTTMPEAVNTCRDRPVPAPA